MSAPHIIFTSFAIFCEKNIRVGGNLTKL